MNGTAHRRQRFRCRVLAARPRPIVGLAEDANAMVLIEVMLATGKLVTGFTHSEEEATGLTKVVPFLVEDMLKRSGANCSKSPDCQPYLMTDGR